MTTPNKLDLLRMAKEAVQNGQREPARMMLEQVLRQDEREVRAMLWMAKLARTPEERTTWLNRVLDVDPDNKTASRALRKMENRDVAQRNRLYLRIGSAAYVGLMLLFSLILILIFA